MYNEEDSERESKQPDDYRHSPRNNEAVRVPFHPDGTLSSPEPDESNYNASNSKDATVVHGICLELSELYSKTDEQDYEYYTHCDYQNQEKHASNPGQVTMRRSEPPLFGHQR